MIGHDGPRGLELRKVHRAAHLAGLERSASGRDPPRGPMLGDDGAPLGSVVGVRGRQPRRGAGIAARDPYVTHGIFARYECARPTVRVPALSARANLVTSDVRLAGVRSAKYRRWPARPYTLDARGDPRVGQRAAAAERRSRARAS
jgi:uncharacterized protein YciI